MEKRLQRIPYEGALAGVCAGLAAYFQIDKVWIRVLFVCSIFFAGAFGIGFLGPILYIVLWIVLPIKSASFADTDFHVDYRENKTTHPLHTTPKNTPYTYDFKPTTTACKSPGKKSKDKYVMGVILLTVGFIFLLHQLDLFYWRDIARFWPVSLMIIGLMSIISSFSTKHRSILHEESLLQDTETEGKPADDDSTTNTYHK